MHNCHKAVISGRPKHTVCSFEPWLAPPPLRQFGCLAVWRLSSGLSSVDVFRADSPARSLSRGLSSRHQSMCYATIKKRLNMNYIIIWPMYWHCLKKNRWPSKEVINFFIRMKLELYSSLQYHLSRLGFGELTIVLLCLHVNKEEACRPWFTLARFLSRFIIHASYNHPQR